MPITLGLLSGGGSSQPSIIWTDDQRDGVNKSTFNFTVDYGTAAASRFLIVQAMLSGGSITSMKVDGVARTALLTGSGSGTEFGIYIIAMPTGTSGLVTITGNSSPFAAAVAVHAVYGCNITPKSSGTKSGGINGNSFPAISMNGGDVAYFTDYGDSTSVTWTGATATVTSYVNGSSNRYGCATLQASSGGSYTVSTNRTNTTWPKYLVWGR